MSGELTNWDINAYYKGNKNYGGCLSKDQLTMAPANKFYIVNMEDSHLPGSHWVLVYDGALLQTEKHVSSCFYFDSYGISPPPPIRDFMRRSKKRLCYSDAQYQMINTSTCGVFCIYVANELLRGKTPLEVITRSLVEKEPAKNEIIMRNLIPSIV